MAPKYILKYFTCSILLLLCCYIYVYYNSARTIEKIRTTSPSNLFRKNELLNELNLSAVMAFKITNAVGKEKTRKIALPLDARSYARVTKSAEQRKIYLATNYHGRSTSSDFYFLRDGRYSFQRYNCPVKDCIVTRNDSDIHSAHALLFHMRDITILELSRGFENNNWKRNYSQKWILYTMEPPWLELLDLKRLDNVFNWTMTYRMDSDLPVRYGFVGKRNNFDTNLSPNYSEKNKLAVLIISDCSTQSRREQYSLEMKKYVQVDIVGGCGKKFCRPAESRECYKKLSHYFFYLAFENALCKDYVTEKFYNILNSNLVPVVFGGAQYETLAPNNSYINALDFESPEKLSKYLEKISKNQTLYEQFFEWKKEGQSYLQAWTCDLCAKLHSDDYKQQSVKTDLQKWWLDDAHCHTWTPERLIDAVYPVLPSYNTGQFQNS